MSINYPKASYTDEQINVKEYGATGDGSTDDTDAIQAAIDAMESAGGGKLVFPGGATYRAYRLDVYQCSGWEIDLCGSTIKCPDTTGTVQGGDHVLRIRQCDDWILRNGTIDGNRDNRGSLAEVSAQSVVVRQGSNWLMENVASDNAAVDGFYISPEDNTDIDTFPANWTMLNCSADNGWRQGLSIINSINGRVIGGAYTNTTGTAPQAGIDIECNASSADPAHEGLLLSGVRLAGNVGYGVIATSTIVKTIGIVIDGCYFTDCDQGAIQPGTHTVINNCTFETFATCTDAGIINLASATVPLEEVKITNNRFVNITASKPCIYIHGSTNGKHQIVGNTASNVYDFASVWSNHCLLSGNVVDSPTKTSAIINVRGGFNQVVNNRILNGLQNAVYIDSETYEHTLVQGNQFYSCDQTASASYGLVRVVDGAADVLGNLFDAGSIWSLEYDTGNGTEPSVGDAVTCPAGGAGTVKSIDVDSGAFGDGDAAGTVVINVATGTFENGVGDDLSFPAATAEISGVNNETWAAVRVDSGEGSVVHNNRTVNMDAAEGDVFDDNGAGNDVGANVINGTYTA